MNNLTDDELRKSPEKGNLISYMKKLETINHGNVDNQLRAGIRQFENRSEMGDEEGEGSSGRTWSPVRRMGRRLCGSDMDTCPTAERNDSQEGNIFSFTGDAGELPEPDYTPLSKDKDGSNSLRFFKVTKSRGRPKGKRESNKKKNNLDLDLEMANFFPMKKVEERQPRKRKPRSDKGKKRKSYKTDLSQYDDSNMEAPLRAPRVPRTMEALQREYGETSRPSDCHSCDVLLDYEGLSEDDEDEVVMCRRCRSYLHKSCLYKCVMCKTISAKLQTN